MSVRLDARQTRTTPELPKSAVEVAALVGEAIRSLAVSCGTIFRLSPSAVVRDVVCNFQARIGGDGCGALHDFRVEVCRLSWHEVICQADITCDNDSINVAEVDFNNLVLALSSHFGEAVEVTLHEGGLQIILRKNALI